MEQKELTIRDVLVSAEFIIGIEDAVKALKISRAKTPPPGMYFKHGPYELLKAGGYFSDLTKIMTEFALIITGTSKLPASQRNFIAGLCAPRFNKAKDELLKANKLKHESNLQTT